jgi:hypothetical protein
MRTVQHAQQMIVRPRCLIYHYLVFTFVVESMCFPSQTTGKWAQFDYVFYTESDQILLVR